jgi:hypothetical protein
MFGLIGSIFGSVINGVVAPLFGWLQNKDNVTLGEFQAMTAAEKDTAVAYLQAYSQLNAAKVSANSWFGAHVMIYMFGLPAALHWSAVFLDSTFKFGWRVPALPGAYAGAEMQIALSFFILAPALPIISGVAGMLSRR